MFQEFCEIFAELQRESVRNEKEEELLNYMKNTGIISFYSMFRLGELPDDISEFIKEKFVKRQIEKQNEIFGKLQKEK